MAQTSGQHVRDPGEGGCAVSGEVWLNVGCGEFRAEGWLNIDMVETESIRPDRVVDLYDLPDDITDLSAVYCGHVLEHIPPDRIEDVLSTLSFRMRSWAPIVVVGPDIDRATHLYRAGLLDQATFDMCHADVGDKQWFGDYHYWECREADVVRHLEFAGFQRVRALPLDSVELDPYPVVSRAPWQCAAIGWAP